MKIKFDLAGEGDCDFIKNNYILAHIFYMSNNILSTSMLSQSAALIGVKTFKSSTNAICLCRKLNHRVDRMKQTHFEALTAPEQYSSN